MDAHREFEGKDLEEAIRLAGQALGVPTEALAYTLLEEGRRGVFGLGARQVRIRVALEDVELIRGEAPSLAPPSVPESAEPAEPVAPAPAPKPAEPRRRPDGRDKRREPRPRPTAVPSSSAPEPKPAPTAAAVRPEPEVLEALRDVVARMLALMGLDVRVDVQTVEDGCVVRIEGDDRAVLVDNDGDVLGSIEFLLNRMGRRSWPSAGSIRVHCDGFRNSRDREIIEMTREVASRVVRTGQPQKLHPMNPYERRLVHMTAREIPGIASTSEGEGFLKRITLESTRDAE